MSDTRMISDARAPGRRADVTNLLSGLKDRGPSLPYQEIRRTETAIRLYDRWPLLREVFRSDAVR
jgi:hypothetical protein